MAILGPDQLPVVLQVPSDPVKFEALSTLGYPVVNIEVTEPQMEQVLRTTGDFIATYFPLEQKYAFFMTEPLRSTYPIPEDAYWIQDVKWDPVTTRIDDIFGAESFLFCYPGGSNVLTEHGPMLCEALFDRVHDTKIMTAFNPHKPKMRWNTKEQSVVLLKTEKDFLVCTPNHPVSCDGKFVPANGCEIGHKLINHKDKQCEIIDKHYSKTDGTWSLQNKTGSIYVSALGKEFYLAH